MNFVEIGVRNFVLSLQAEMKFHLYGIVYRKNGSESCVYGENVTEIYET